MEKLIIILKNSLKMYIVLTVYLLFISIFYYFEILDYKVINIINYIVILSLYFILGFLTSSKIKSKGYLNGFTAGFLNILIFILFSLITKNMSLNLVIYYTLLILASVVGGIVGVEKIVK